MLDYRLENRVILDNTLKLFLISSAVFVVDFTNGDAHICENNTGSNITQEHAKWGAIVTKEFLVSWNRISTDYSTKNSYIMNIFDKQTGKIVQEFEFEQKSNEPEFFVSACPTEDKKDFVVLVSEKRVDTNTWEFIAESELYFVSVASMTLQHIANIPDEVFKDVYAGNDAFILVGHR